jgi:hypothetical protein
MNTPITKNLEIISFFEKLNLIERVDQLIRLKATGTADDLAKKLGISRRNVYLIIDVMKSMDAPILYDIYKKIFYYEYDCELSIGFIEKEKIKGGEAKFLNYFKECTNFAQLYHTFVTETFQKGDSEPS